MPGRQRTYCSAQCQARRPGQSKPRPKQQRPSGTCLACGCDFVQTRIDKTTCSRHCWNVSRGRARLKPLPVRYCALPSCDAEFQPFKLGQRCCSEPHGKKLWHVENPGAHWSDARRDGYHRRRAQKANTSTGRPVILSEIRARDGNRCHLCRRKVSNQPWPHPLSASMDHVVPLSKGGAHDPDNVRLAHLRCNVEKGAGGGNEQLLLIG